MGDPRTSEIGTSKVFSEGLGQHHENGPLSPCPLDPGWDWVPDLISRAETPVQISGRAERAFRRHSDRSLLTPMEGDPRNTEGYGGVDSGKVTTMQALQRITLAGRPCPAATAGASKGFFEPDVSPSRSVLG